MSFYVALSFLSISLLDFCSSPFYYVPSIFFYFFNKTYVYTVYSVFAKLILVIFSFFLFGVFSDSFSLFSSRTLLLFYWLLFLLFILVSANDLFFIFVVLEFIAILTITVVLLNSSKISVYLSILYFFLNIFFSGLYILGLFFIYFRYQSFNIDFLYVLWHSDFFSNIGFILIFIVFFFKLGIAPFHF